MAFFQQQQPRKDDLVNAKPEPKADQPKEAVPSPPPPHARHVEESAAASAQSKAAESLVASGLTIEGKIEGTGNVRIAGRFKGTVSVRGEFKVEPGASIEGDISADTVFVGGEVRGKIVAVSRVEFRESGSLVGDLKAGSLTVAAGSKMRGNVEFGWKEGELQDLPSRDRGSSPNR
jgi:cytoskeletal protein CcmA (bactofilin family)